MENTRVILTQSSNHQPNPTHLLHTPTHYYHPDISSTQSVHHLLHEFYSQNQKWKQPYHLLTKCEDQTTLDSLSLSQTFLQRHQQQNKQKQKSQQIQEQQQTSPQSVITINQLTNHHLLNHRLIFFQPSLRPIQSQTDPSFPPNTFSLSQHSNKGKWDIIQWKPISQILPSSHISDPHLSPLQIKQGILQNAYFLSALAALAQKPYRLSKILERRQQYFVVKIFHEGKCHQIYLDEFVPTIKNIPAFGHSTKNTLWVMLIEKAWAKLYGSYKKIESGFPEEVLQSLTGAPIKNIQLRHSQNYEKQWKYLKFATQNDYIVIGSTKIGSDLQQADKGFLNDNYYTIISAFTIQTGNIVKLRNPWMKNQKFLDEETEGKMKERDEKQYKIQKKMGIMYMKYEILKNYFRNITIAEIDDESSYIYRPIKVKNRQPAYFVIQVIEDSCYTLIVDKKSERVRANKKYGYRYPEGKIEMSKIEKDRIRYMEGIITRKKTMNKIYFLRKGKYIASVKILDPEVQYHEIVLGVYSKIGVHLKEATQIQIKYFENGYLNEAEMEKQVLQKQGKSMTESINEKQEMKKDSVKEDVQSNKAETQELKQFISEDQENKEAQLQQSIKQSVPSQLALQDNMKEKSLNSNESIASQNIQNPDESKHNWSVHSLQNANKSEVRKCEQQNQDHKQSENGSSQNKEKQVQELIELQAINILDQINQSPALSQNGVQIDEINERAEGQKRKEGSYSEGEQNIQKAQSTHKKTKITISQKKIRIPTHILSQNDTQKDINYLMENAIGEPEILQHKQEIVENNSSPELEKHLNKIDSDQQPQTKVFKVTKVSEEMGGQQ